MSVFSATRTETKNRSHLRPINRLSWALGQLRCCRTITQRTAEVEGIQHLVAASLTLLNTVECQLQAAVEQLRKTNLARGLFRLANVSHALGLPIRHAHAPQVLSLKRFRLSPVVACLDSHFKGLPMLDPKYMPIIPRASREAQHHPPAVSPNGTSDSARTGHPMFAHVAQLGGDDPSLKMRSASMPMSIGGMMTTAPM